MHLFCCCKDDSKESFLFGLLFYYVNANKNYVRSLRNVLSEMSNANKLGMIITLFCRSKS